MIVTFHVFVSTFVDDRSAVFSSTGNVDVREVLQYINEHFLKDIDARKIVQSFSYFDKWCCVVIFREIGETVVRGERRKFNEIRLAVSDRTFDGDPTPATTMELIKNLENIRPAEFSKLQPISIQIDQTNEKKQEALVKKMSDAKPFLLFFIAIIAIGMFASFLSSNVGEIYYKRLFSSAEKPLVLPHETEEPSYYTEVVNSINENGVPIIELLKPISDGLKSELRNMNIECKNDNRRLEFIVLYFYWGKVLSSVLDSEILGITTAGNIAFVCDPKNSSEELFERLHEKAESTGITIRKLGDNAQEKIKNLVPKPDLNIRNLIVDDVSKQPLILFFPISNTESDKGEVNGFVPATYKEGCKYWKEVYGYWGYQNAEEVRIEKIELVKNMLEEIAKQLLEEEKIK